MLIVFDIKSCNIQNCLIVFIIRCWSMYSLDKKYVWIIWGFIVIIIVVIIFLVLSLIDKL